MLVLGRSLIKASPVITVSNDDGDDGGDASTTLTVTEVDGTPNIAATVLELPNGTVTDQGAGVARYTPVVDTVNHQYVGYPTIGGSTEAMVRRVHYYKQITLTQPGIIWSVSAYIANVSASYVEGIIAGVYEDNGQGAIGRCICYGCGTRVNTYMNLTPRWLHKMMGMYLAAGTYWLMVGRTRQIEASAGLNIYYDAGGTDRTINAGGDRFIDGGLVAPTNTTRKYSIRADFLPC